MPRKLPTQSKKGNNPKRKRPPKLIILQELEGTGDQRVHLADASRESGRAVGKGLWARGKTSKISPFYIFTKSIWIGGKLLSEMDRGRRDTGGEFRKRPYQGGKNCGEAC